MRRSIRKCKHCTPGRTERRRRKVSRVEFNEFMQVLNMLRDGEWLSPTTSLERLQYAV
jgi:hypothetical protein